MAHIDHLGACLPRRSRPARHPPVLAASRLETLLLIFSFEWCILSINNGCHCENISTRCSLHFLHDFLAFFCVSCPQSLKDMPMKLHETINRVVVETFWCLAMARTAVLLNNLSWKARIWARQKNASALRPDAHRADFHQKEKKCKKFWVMSQPGSLDCGRKKCIFSNSRL